MRPRHVESGLSCFLSVKSAQRESNPHFRLGKAAGCRYIMGALQVCRIVKDQEHRVGVEPTSPRYECGILATGRPVRFCQWDQRDLNPHLAD